MAVSEAIAGAALALVGTPFRLRGREQSTGVDCVGLVLLALRAAGVTVREPPPYQMRGTGQERAETVLRASGLRAVARAAVGDILLVRSGPLQLHLMICAPGDGQQCLVHAHAGLGRVVLMPGDTPWPVLSRWRADLPQAESD
jgi:lipoprotein Spr